MKKIALIGATGSIGRQVVEVVERHADKFKIVAMCANSPSDEFTALKERVRPEFCALASQDRQAALSVAEFAKADIIFNAAGGFAGLEYSLRAAEAGKAIALANKETLVCGGDIILPLAASTGAEILPVDSEHSAIWQCLHFDAKEKVKRLIITASGGAFRGRSFEELKTVTPEQALNHPTWNMGAKITVDSATLMNKGYEVIEANRLFGTPYKDICTVIQPQSIVHSLAEFADGSCIAQLGRPTMEVPIQLALTFPERYATAVEPLDFTKAFSIEFTPLVREDYPLYDIAVACGEQGGISPCALNAADEVAVRAFLRGEIAFTDIYSVVYGAVDAIGVASVTGFEQLVDVDATARRAALKIIEGLK